MNSRGAAHCVQPTHHDPSLSTTPAHKCQHLQGGGSRSSDLKTSALYNNTALPLICSNSQKPSVEPRQIKPPANGHLGALSLSHTAFHILPTPRRLASLIVPHFINSVRSCPVDNVSAVGERLKECFIINLYH